MALDFPTCALYITVFDGPVGTSPARLASSGVIAARAKKTVSALFRRVFDLVEMLCLFHALVGGEVGEQNPLLLGVLRLRWWGGIP